MAGEVLHGLPLYQKAFGHAIVDGALSGGANEFQGSSFRDGFIAAFASLGRDIGFAGVALRVAAAAVVGGTVAEITGGRFSNGAITAAFCGCLMMKAQTFTVWVRAMVPACIISILEV